MKIGAARIVLALLGLVFLVLGLLAATAATTRDTTVLGEGGVRVHNTGLIAKQQADTTLYAALAIVGAVLLGSAAVIEAIQVHGRYVAELAEKENKGQAAMVRLLDSIAANTQTAAAPVRRASSKADADFDAAIAAELASTSPRQRP